MHFWTGTGRIAATLAGLLSLPAPLFAHPHVFAEARLDVAVGEDRQVERLRHVWRFDDLFSSTVLVEFDKDQNLELDSTELQQVADVIHQSLAEFDYFQVVTANGKDVKMRPPEQIIADFTDNQLIVLFESRPEEPVPLEGKLRFGVYDPTFYTAIDFVEDSYLAVENLPQDCKRSVIRPDPEDAIAQNQETLTEAFFNEPGGNNLSQIFATKLEILCDSDG